MPEGTELSVVPTKLVPFEVSGSTYQYYQVSFNGSSKVQNNAVDYLSYTAPGLYYIDSRYLNFTKKGAKEQEGEAPGEITNSKTPMANTKSVLDRKKEKKGRKRT